MTVRTSGLDLGGISRRSIANARRPFTGPRRAASPLALIAAMTIACGRGAAPKAALSIDAAAESYVRIVLALADRDEDSLDSYHGPERWQAEARARHAPLDVVRADAVRLRSDLNAQGPGDAESRRAFLIRQLDAIIARVDIVRGARPPFGDEFRQLFAFDVTSEVGGSGSTAIRGELARLLPGSGDLARRYAAFDARFRIERSRLPAMVERALAICRRTTAAHVALPDGERIEIAYVPGLAWSAFTRYEGKFVSRIAINPAIGVTVDRVLDLACHEGYPGHHTIEALIEQRFGTSRAELLVQPLFSPQTLLHEAAASVAPTLAFTDAERVEIERDELFPLVGLNPEDAERHVRVSRLVDRLNDVEADVTRRYLDGELDFPRASAAFERDALMPSPDAALTFINRFRSYAATYTIGRDRFAAAVAGRWPTYLQLVTDQSQAMAAPTLKESAYVRGRP
jgi:hypothetical protein